MPRRRTLKKKELTPDPVYNNILIDMIVNRLMKKGKKLLAYRLLYKTIKQLEKKTEQEPIEFIQQAIKNITPRVEIKAKRVRGSVYQIPVDVNKSRGQALALKWFLTACRNRAGKDMTTKLTNEFLDASKNLGNAVRKREEVHKIAEANRVYAKTKRKKKILL